MGEEKIVLAVVLLTCAYLSLVLHCCEARSDGLESTARRRMLAQSDPDSSSGSHRPTSFSLVMLHRDHEQSPLRDSRIQNLTLLQRVNEAAKRSTLRTKSLRQKIQSLAAERSPNNGSRSTHASRKAQLLAVETPIFCQQGEFILHIYLGTPAQKFVAILDSGSDLAWVQCKPCKDCVTGVPDALFDPTLSSSYKEIPCDDDFCDSLPSTSTSPACAGDTCPFEYRYGDGTVTTGDLATETITFPVMSGSATSSAPDFAFGCGSGPNSGDLSGTDGIVGIGRGALSLPDQLSATTGANLFSFCLVSTFLASTETSPLFMGSDAFAAAGGSKWTPLLTNDFIPTFYYVQIKAIKVNGQALAGIPASAFNIDDSNGQGGTIIDTGTTVTEIVAPAYDVLVASLKHEVKFPTVPGDDYGFDVCWDISAGAVTNSAGGAGGASFGFGSDELPSSLPSIAFQMRWSDFELPPENAFLRVTTSVICLTFGSGSGLNIIGNMHLQNFQIFVNNDHAKLGWKPAQCDQI